jgi:hypothetical protein
MRLQRLACLLLALSCSRGEDAPRLWEPSDHDHATEPVPAPAEPPATSARVSPSARPSEARDAGRDAGSKLTPRATTGKPSDRPVGQ